MRVQAIRQWVLLILLTYPCALLQVGGDPNPVTAANLTNTEC